MLENATSENGGTPDAPLALADSLLEVVREGLPYYQRGNRDPYAENLRETGLKEHAEAVERGAGVRDRTDALSPEET